MSRVFYIVFVLLCSLAGMWGGYWLGHLAGWSENADWPGQVGGGTGAMALAVVFALAGIVAGTGIITLPTVRATRRLLRHGVPARATVITIAKAGLTLRSPNKMWEKICCRLEVHPPEGAPFEAQARQFVGAVEERRLTPEAEVTIRYDPRRPRRAVIEHTR